MSIKGWTKNEMRFSKDMPKNTLNELHNQSVMVDANVLAAEFVINPLVIMMCIAFQNEKCRQILTCFFNGIYPKSMINYLIIYLNRYNRADLQLYYTR